MMDPDYQINELAKRAGVSVRTIRFYIDEGLLPAPQARGRYSAYGDEYLDRLELIRLLKDRFLPLKEIRRQVSALGWEEIKAALAHERETGQAAAGGETRPGPGGADSSALDYINHLLNGQASRSPGPSRPAQPAGETRPLRTAQPTAPLRPAAEEVWERIRLAPGVELHIQKPASPANQLKLEELVEFARRLFYS